jgi:hypothetical protein
MTKYFTCAETAKLIRQSLKEAFPDVKFSVRSSTYSGGALISVNWPDGPNAAQVESITKGFKVSYFDGSIDYQGSIHHMMGGEPVRFGADYITSSRRYSDAAVDRAIASVSRRTLATSRRPSTYNFLFWYLRFFGQKILTPCFNFIKASAQYIDLGARDPDMRHATLRNHPKFDIHLTRSNARSLLAAG